MSDQLNFKQVPFDTMYYNNLSKKGGQVLIECDPNRTVLKIIESCITKNNTVLSDAELAQWILRYHIQRTKNHVENVKLCANYLREFFQFGGYFDRFIAKVQQHDYDKLQGNEHVASFALNAPLYKYKDLYEISPEAKRIYDEIEWPKHHQLNDHHPENYMHCPDPEKKQWVISDEELEDTYKDKGGHPAILMALGEMVADWAAVGIEMGDTAKDWWLKNKDKRWSYGPRYTQALEACLEWIPSKLYVQSSEPIPEPPKLKMNVTSNISEERISQAVVNNIKDGLVYHASPIKLAFLAGKHTGNWSGEQGNVFVTPVKGLAACFVINKNDVVDKAEQQLGGRLIGLNFGYDIWNKPIDKLRALPREIVVTLNVRGLKPFTGESTGYLYTIDYTKYADKTHMFRKNPNSDVEFLIEGDVHYKSCEKITIKWKCVSSEDDIKRHGEAKVDSDPSLDSVYNVSTTLSSVSDEGLFDPVVEEGMYYTIRNFPVVQFFNKLRKEYKTTKLEHLFKVIGIRFFFAQKRTISIHKFFIPELLYLLDKFRFPVSLIDMIKSHTWVGDVVQPTEFADLTVLNKEINAKFYEHQIEFIKNYVSNKTMNHLRGYLLSFEQGLGKTITALGLMTALKKEHVVIICPKNTMLETWNTHLIKFFNQKQKVWIAGYTKGPLTTSYRWIIVNYERIDEVKEFLVKNKLNNLGVIVDESHNFLRTSSLRTQLLLDLARYNQNADLLLLSGTPIKCAGVELIPIMSVLDPYFDEEACTIFKATFGFNTAIANDVLNARLTRMITRVTKDILSLPEKKETTVSVHMPTGWKYTVSQVEKQIITFVKERQDYYQQNLTTYITAFEEAIKWLQNEPGIGDQPEFQRYMDVIDELKNSSIVDARGNADIVWANQYERDVLIPALPDDLKKKFIWSKSVVKYLPLKIKGEVIGTLLTHLRMQMTTEMMQAADIKQYVDKAMKKTVVFTSYVDTIEVAYNYFQSNGYNVAAVYGKTASELTATVKRFQEDQSVNPLIASLKMISTGATLTAANTVIFLNKPWRSIEYQQASDRVHRIGQDTDCDIISLVLDTGKEANLSTRMEDIMQWSGDQFDQIVDKKEREMMKKFFRGFESLDIPEDCNEFNDSFSENMNCDVVSNELFSFFGNNGSTPISIKSLDKMKLQTLSKHSDLIEALDQWILVPDKRLLPKLIELGKIVDSIYSIKEMTVYRGIDVGFMYKGKIQDTMGLTEGFFNTLKDGVGIGYTFKYGITKPLSTTTDVKIASAFGSVIVEGSIPRFVSKLVITDELSYLVCKRRNIEPSTQKECIIFPGSHIAFKVISTGSQEVFNASLEQYDPPYNEEQMREHGYAEEVIERLKRDPAHSWRMKTGIELIHIELTRTELKRIWKNWQQMTPDQKRISDRKCRELFGCDNKTLYEYLIPQYKVESPDKGVVKYPPKSDGSSSEAISADTKTKIKEITFPAEEIDTLKKQNRIVTTRVSADYNKFFVDDLVQTPWGDIFKVTKREEISDVKDHPYFNELTEGQKKFLSKYDKIAVLTLMKTKVQDALSFSTEAQVENDDRGPISESDKKKIGKYIYHGTHRDLDIKNLGIHVCKNRANTDIKAPVVYMNRTLGVASLHVVPFMIGHGSKLKNYEEHFVNLEEAISSESPVKHVEIVHNDPDLEECSGEQTGYIYWVEAKEFLDDLYYATPEKPNDWNFVSYRQLPIAKKTEVKVTWHKKYDPDFAKKVKGGFMAVESMALLTSTPEERRLTNLAKPLYVPIGKNSWEHIQQDVGNAIDIIRTLQGRDLTLKEYATILFHDCSVKARKSKDRHSYYSAEIARQILSKTTYFTSEDIDEICQAIEEHDEFINPNGIHSSDLSDLLASADCNPPNVAWILNKSYSRGMENGLTHEERIQNAVRYIPKKYGTHGTIVYPKMYAAFNKKAIIKMQQTFDTLTPEECERIIMDYRRRHGLKEGDLSLPDPSLESISSDVKFKGCASLEFVSEEAQQSSTPSKIAQKKKKILDYICKLCDTMEPSGLNSKRYRRIIGQMNDKEFDQFMNYMKEGKWQLHLVAPNMIVNLQNEDLLKACDLIGLDLFQRVWMYDRATGRKYLTDNKYMFVKLPIRRQQQFLDEKISVPDNDRTIDGLTGQVTGDSRSCSITNPEIQILAARGLDKTMQELVNIRGGNIHGYSEFRRMLEENGEADLDMIDPNSRTRASVVGSKLLQSMMLDTNL